MKKGLKTLLSLLLIFSLTTTAVFGELITTGAGTKIDIGDGKDFGPSSGYDPNGNWNDISKRAKKREKDLRKAAKELEKDLKKAKNKKERAKITGWLDKIAKEITKNHDEHKFEDKLIKDPNKPKNNPHKDAWKRKMRKERLKKLGTKQLELEKKRKKEKEKAQKLKKILDQVGTSIFGDVSLAHDDVTDANSDLNDAITDLNHAGCSDDSNNDGCNDYKDAVTTATLDLNQKKIDFKKIARTLPPILLAGGGVYKIIDGLLKLQDSHRTYLDAHRIVDLCEQNCDDALSDLDYYTEQLQRDQILEGMPLNEIEDEVKALDYSGEDEVEVLVPAYLKSDSSVPFGNKDALPLLFGINDFANEGLVTNLKVNINGKDLPVDYYPEVGILKTQYVGFDEKESFEGRVSVKTITGRVFEQEFNGKINIKKPEIKITKKGGGFFKKASFHVEIKGEFDNVKITGANIKPQNLSFDETQTYKKIKVKTLSRSGATIKVEASLKTKVAKIPTSFDGESYSTDSLGRVIDPAKNIFNRLDSIFDNPNVAKADLGFCCENVGELTCEGCIAGKRTKKSCRALNKLPGYNFKAFLRAKDLSCSAL